MERIESFCREILKSRRILNKIVILCEGEISEKNRNSSAVYSRMESPIPIFIQTSSKIGKTIDLHFLTQAQKNK